MKKTTFILAALLSAACISAQETLTLEQCREMALKYNKEMAAAARQTESARYTAKSYKGNFFPNFSLSGTGIYSTSDGSLGIAGGNLPTFLPDATGQFLPNKGFAYFPGIDLNYKIGMVYMGGVQVEQPLYMGGKIRAAYKMSLLGKEMAQLSETLTASEVIVKTEQAYAQVIKAKEMKKVADKYNAVLTELMKNVESAHKHGLKPQNDVLKVQVKLNESELNIRKADNALRLATMNLCHYIGKPLTADIRTADTFPEVAQDIRLQTADISAPPRICHTEPASGHRQAAGETEPQRTPAQNRRERFVRLHPRLGNQRPGPVRRRQLLCASERKRTALPLRCKQQ